MWMIKREAQDCICIILLELFEAANGNLICIAFKKKGKIKTPDPFLNRGYID
jgi:hypothetical protein